MLSRCYRLMMLSLAPIALAACAEPTPVVARTASATPAIGADLGGSSRIPKIAGLAGEGERVGETQTAMAQHDHGSMPDMQHGASHGAGHSHSSGSGTPMVRAGHGNDHGAVSRPAAGKQMAHTGHGRDQGAAVSRPAAGKQMAHAAHGHDHTASKPRAAGGGAKMAHAGHSHAQGTGTVNSIDAAARKVNVTHDPIPAIGWPTMTMDFPVAPAVDLNALSPGARIKFEMEQGQGGMYVIQSIAPAPATAGGRRR